MREHCGSALTGPCSGGDAAHEPSQHCQRRPAGRRTRQTKHPAYIRCPPARRTDHRRSRGSLPGRPPGAAAATGRCRYHRVQTPRRPAVQPKRPTAPHLRHSRSEDGRTEGRERMASWRRETSVDLDLGANIMNHPSSLPKLSVL